MARTIHLNPPEITEEQIRSLNRGDIVSLTGIIVTGRDVAHKYIEDTFLSGKEVSAEDAQILESLKKYLSGGVLYHAGPVVMKDEKGELYFTAAGPTTSIREEPYEYDVIRLLGLRGVIGKGGMGDKTLKACSEFGSVYLHAIGGAAAYIAQSVKKVVTRFKDEFGTPESFWVIEVENFECVVTMDAHGDSLHSDIRSSSEAKAKEIMKGF